MNQKNLIAIVALATALLTYSHQILVAQGPKPAQDQGCARVATPSKTEFLRLVNESGMRKTEQAWVQA